MSTWNSKIEYALIYMHQCQMDIWSTKSDWFYIFFIFRIMTNGSLPRDKKPTKENTDNSSMAGFVKSHPEIINIFFVMPQDTKHDLEADSQNLQICYTTCLHCLDLDLSGQKTRRNFWRVQGMLGTCHISLSEKLPKWHFLTHAWKSNFLVQMYSFRLSWSFFIKPFWLRPCAYLGI